MENLSQLALPAHACHPAALANPIGVICDCDPRAVAALQEVVAWWDAHYDPTRGTDYNGEPLWVRQ